MEHEELTRQIIGCAYRVFNTMGHGFLESVYENCMLIELQKLGLRVDDQRPIKVYYEGQVVGNFEADLFVEEALGGGSACNAECSCLKFSGQFPSIPAAEAAHAEHLREVAGA